MEESNIMKKRYLISTILSFTILTACFNCSVNAAEPTEGATDSTSLNTTIITDPSSPDQDNTNTSPDSIPTDDPTNTVQDGPNNPTTPPQDSNTTPAPPSENESPPTNDFSPTDEISSPSPETGTRGGDDEEEPIPNYHVIFGHNSKLTYITGGNSTTLSNLITKLGLDISIDNISSIITSNNDIISLSETTDDVVISSLAPFTSNESIIINMNDNETQYVIDVNSDIPEHTKILTDNGNGTFELALSVKGAAVVPSDPPRVNVVVVYDVSNSMINTSNNIMRENPTGRYGIVNNQRTQLYYYSGTSYVQINNDTSIAAGTQVYYRVNNNYSEYTGKRYDYVRRADAAEKTIYDFTERLFGHQSTEDPSNIQMAVITFSHDANVVQGWTSNKNDILSKFSSTGNLNTGGASLTYSRGTNYEVALQRTLEFLRNEINPYQTDEDTTFVIFVTDGAPSQVSGTPDGTFLNAVDCYGPSQDEARNIQTFSTVTHTSNSDNPNTILYGIYAFGSEADYLDDVIYYAHHGEKRENEVATTTPTDYYYNASNTTEFNAAIDNIFNKIIETFGVTNVEINDGTTTNVTLSSGEVANLLEIDQDSFTYWMSKEVDIYTESNEYEYYTTRTDRDNGQLFYVYIVDQDPTDNRIKITYDRPSDNLAPGEHSFDGWVNGYIHNNVMTIQWKKSGAELSDDTGLSPDLFFGQEPPDAEVVNGSVVWNLTDEDQPLLNGVTYTVKFNVWKTQRVFDIIADLENGKIDYSDLESTGLDQYILRYCDEDECNYVVRTNTTATLSYSDTRVSEDEMSASFVNPNGIAVAKETIRIEKRWINILDSRESDDVTIILYQQKVAGSDIDTSTMTAEELAAYNEEYGPKEYLILDLNKEDNWTIDKVNISPGLMTIDYIYETTITGRQKLVAKEGGVRILDEGYDYFFVEEGNNKYYWQLVAETIHPMVINGTLTELIRMDENALNQFALNGEPLDDYYIPVEFSDPNSDYLFVTSDKGNHFIKIGNYVYLINEVSEIDFITSLASWPAEPGIPNELTVHLVDDIGDIFDTFYMVRDDSTEEGYRIYYSKDESEGHAIYSYHEKNNAFLDKYGPAGGLINYQIEIEPWLSDEEYAALSDEQKREYNRILSVISNDYLSFRHENNDINPTIGAVNYRRSNLNIQKEVNGQAPANEIFTFDINVYDPGNLITDESGNILLDDLYFSVWDLSIGDYIDYGETIGNYSKEYNNDNIWTGYYHGANSQDNILTIGLTTAQSIRFLNLTTEATYSVTEHDIPKYIFEGGTGTLEQNVIINERDNSSFIISEESGVITIDGTRYWNSLDETLPDSITYKILYYQEESDIYVEHESKTVDVVLDQENNVYYAKYVFDNLSADESFIIREIYPDGSVIPIVAISKNLYNSLNITGKTATGKIAMTNAVYYVKMRNVYEVVDVSVTKVWNDADNHDQIRPASVEVTLLQDGNELAKQILNNDNNWSYTWNDLQRFTGEGDSQHEIVYTIAEIATDIINGVDGKNTYSSAVTGDIDNGFIVTNTHTPITSLSILKVWDDADNQDNIRPTEITVTLSNGQSVVLNAANGWTATIDNLPVYNNGNKIDYSWSESTLPSGYTLASNVTVDTLTTITNKHIPEEPEIPEVPDVPEKPEDTSQKPVFKQAVAQLHTSNPLTADNIYISVTMLSMCSFGFVIGIILFRKSTRR